MLMLIPRSQMRLLRSDWSVYGIRPRLNLKMNAAGAATYRQRKSLLLTPDLQHVRQINTICCCELSQKYLEDSTHV